MDAFETRRLLETVIKMLLSICDDLVDSEVRFPQDKQQLVDDRVCLTCGRSLGDSRGIRGNHEYCVKVVNSRIKSGELTETQAVSLGLLTPRQTTGRKKSAIHQRINEVASQIEQRRSTKSSPVNYDIPPKALGKVAEDTPMKPTTIKVKQKSKKG
jgi:hypothetical protein